MIALKVRGGCKNYQQKAENVKVLNNFNLTVRQGTIYCLIGPSGAGKTTLFSCILGITSLDSGSISIFGNDSKNSLKLAKHPKIVGYMPQETNLVEELTVGENLNFFANLYDVDCKKFNERFKVLRNVLEIRNERKKVAECSGGQKRRISLAIAILCEPKLLFLDEPTVGVDPILRENIWKFIRNSVKSKDMTVVVTTHYINEAQQSDCVGMLRNGRLIVEESPKVVCENFKLNSLDDVIMELCRNDEVGKIIEKNNDESWTREQSEVNKKSGGKLRNVRIKIESKRKKFSQQRLKALIRKELLIMFRQPVLIVFITLLPALTFYICGQVYFYPSQIPIALINNEVDCSSLPQRIHQSSSENCSLENFSCLQINEIKRRKIFKLIEFKKFEKSWSEFKKGKFYGILIFRKNFTKQFLRRFEANVKIDEDLYSVDFYPDNTDLNMIQFILKEIDEASKDFLEKLSRANCRFPFKFKSIFPMKFEKAIFGYSKESYLNDMVYATFYGLIFMTSITFCCFSIINDRKSGAWNRELLSGVSTFEIVIAHFIVNIFMMIFELFNLFLVYKLTMELPNEGNIFMELLLTILVYISGICFGLWFSCETENYFLVVFTSIGLTIVQVFVSGSVWPIEGMHNAIKPIAYIFPANLPAKALKNMFVKGYVWHSSIYVAFLVPLGWILFSFLGFTVTMKRKKFS